MQWTHRGGESQGWGRHVTTQHVHHDWHHAGRLTSEEALADGHPFSAPGTNTQCKHTQHKHTQPQPTKTDTAHTHTPSSITPSTNPEKRPCTLGPPKHTFGLCGSQWRGSGTVGLAEGGPAEPCSAWGGHGPQGPRKNTDTLTATTRNQPTHTSTSTLGPHKPSPVARVLTHWRHEFRPNTMESSKWGRGSFPEIEGGPWQWRDHKRKYGLLGRWQGHFRKWLQQRCDHERKRKGMNLSLGIQDVVKRFRCETSARVCSSFH